jgi:hypothetical protein
MEVKGGSKELLFISRSNCPGNFFLDAIARKHLPVVVENVKLHLQGGSPVRIMCQVNV